MKQKKRRLLMALTTNALVVQFTRPGAALPIKAHDGDAGYDLTCCESSIIHAWHVTKILLGIRWHLPEGCYARIVGRSSSLLNGLYVHESIIDNGYRGEIYVVATGWGRDIEVIQGQRVAQVLLYPLVHIPLSMTDEVSYASIDGRGINGFGSSGGW
jgi:dUTP pyrophosphatase